MDRANPSFATLISAFHDPFPLQVARSTKKDIALEIGGREQRQTPPASPGKMFLRGKGQKDRRKDMSCFIMDENTTRRNGGRP